MKFVGQNLLALITHLNISMKLASRLHKTTGFQNTTSGEPYDRLCPSLPHVVPYFSSSAPHRTLCLMGFYHLFLSPYILPSLRYFIISCTGHLLFCIFSIYLFDVIGSHLHTYLSTFRSPPRPPHTPSHFSSMGRLIMCLRASELASMHF